MADSLVKDAMPASDSRLSTSILGMQIHATTYAESTALVCE